MSHPPLYFRILVKDIMTNEKLGYFSLYNGYTLIEDDESYASLVNANLLPYVCTDLIQQGKLPCPYNFVYKWKAPGE